MSTGVAIEEVDDAEEEALKVGRWYVSGIDSLIEDRRKFAWEGCRMS